TATGLPLRPWSSTCRRSVVLPLPRKPVRMSTATVDTRASDDRVPGETVGNRLAEQPEQRGRDVVDRRPLLHSVQWRGRAVGGEDEEPVPVVVGFVRTRVVLEGVDAAHADRPDRSPGEIAEVDE